MTFRTTSYELTGRVALGLAIAAIAVPGATAADFSAAGPTSGPTVGQLVTVDAPRSGPTASQLPSMYSFDGPRSGGPVAPDLSRYSHGGPRSGPATSLPAFSVDAPRTAPISLPVAAPAVIPTDAGIDWRSIGIGAALGLAFAALALVVFHLVNRRRHTLAV